MEDDRRKHPRITVLPADLRILKVQPYEVTSIVDMSRGGIKVEVTGPAPAVGTLLDIHMQMPGGDAIVSGMVRHVTEKTSSVCVLGIEFDDPDLIADLTSGWLDKTRG